MPLPIERDSWRIWSRRKNFQTESAFVASKAEAVTTTPDQFRSVVRTAACFDCGLGRFHLGHEPLMSAHPALSTLWLADLADRLRVSVPSHRLDLR
jgi:hypothetical protein